MDELFAALARSPFRSRFRLGNREQRYLQERGNDAILHHAAEIIRTRLAPAQPLNDGKQTPMRGHPVFIAQHATATCCRGCLAKWHGIERGREMSDEEQRYVVAVIGQWLSAAQPHAEAAGKTTRQLSLFPIKRPGEGHFSFPKSPNNLESGQASS